MKRFMKFSLSTLCAILFFVACDKEVPETNDDKTPEQETPVNPNPEEPGDNTENPGENPGEPENPGENPENPGTDVPSEPDLVIPDNLFEGYYYGDYYMTGQGNASVNFIEGSLAFDDWEGEYVGTGVVVCIDLNIELQDDPDHAVVPVGTYEADSDGTYAKGTWGLEESYILKVVNNEVIYDFAAFTAGTVTVTEDPAGYKYILDLTIEDGEKLHIEYVGPAKLINSTDEGGLCSNLDRDVNVPELTQASMFCVGDILEDGSTETWVISIGDEHYDLLTDYGPGYSILLYFNLEPGLSGVPAGTYSDFIDPLTAVEMIPDTMLGGLSMYGMYMGCFYMCPALTEEAALSSGSVTVAVEEEVYTITGTLYDGYENKVTFSYEGEVEKMVYEPYSVKSTSKSKGQLSRKPAFIKVK